MLRAAIIGCGGIANRHAQAILKLKSQIELTACCDVDLQKAQAFSQQFTVGRARVSGDHHALFSSNNVDLAVICLPPFAHSDEVEIAASRGIHLLVEKPIALTAIQAWKMVEAAETAGIKTQVGFMYRFGAAVEQQLTMQANGLAGKPGLFSARYFCNALHAPWWRMREKSGGQTVEQVIHLFDLMRVLLGEPASVYSQQANLFHTDDPSYTIEDVSATVITFRNGAVGVIYATNAAVPGKWIKEWRLVSKKMVAEFTDWNHAAFTPTAPPSEVQVVASDRDVFYEQMKDLVDAIQSGAPTRTPLREGARSLELVLAAQRSSQSNSVVNL